MYRNKSGNKPAFWPWLALALAGVALTVSLGNWQTRRAAAKEQLQRHIAQAMQAQPLAFDGHVDPGATLEWRRVSLRGQYLRERTVYLDNRIQNVSGQGVVGFYVLTPFQLEDGVTQIIVNRGWIARDAHRIGAVPPHDNPTGVLTVEGVLHKEIGQTLQLAAASSASGPIRASFSVDAYQRETGMTLSPWIVYQLDRAQEARSDGLVRDWQLPALGVEKHRAYALQWYAMACAIALGTVVWLWKRFNRGNEA